MKKILYFSMFLIAGAINTFAQEGETEDPCPHRALVREFVKKNDSLVRFASYIKQAEPENWNAFAASVETDSLNAFREFGENETTYRNTYLEIGDSIDYCMKLLTQAINPEKTLTTQQLKDSVTSLVNCYLSDTTENTLDVLLLASGRTATNLTYLGPCERDARTCMSSAAQAYTTNLIACGFGGVTVHGILKGLWGLVSGGACFLAAQSTRSSAEWSCILNYVDCVEN